MPFNLQDYEPVEERLARFWDEHPEGRVETDIIQSAQEGGQRWIVKALVFRNGDDKPSATGYAFEVDGQGNVNRTSALENCETSAIGRALANLGYAAKGRVSREEMSKIQSSEGSSAAGEVGRGEQAGGGPTNIATSQPPSLSALDRLNSYIKPRGPLSRSTALEIAQSVTDDATLTADKIRTLDQRTLTKILNELEYRFGSNPRAGATS